MLYNNNNLFAIIQCHSFSLLSLPKKKKGQKPRRSSLYSSFDRKIHTKSGETQKKTTITITKKKKENKEDFS